MGRDLNWGMLMTSESGLWRYVLSDCLRMARLVTPVTGLDVFACVFCVGAVLGWAGNADEVRCGKAKACDEFNDMVRRPESGPDLAPFSLLGPARLVSIGVRGGSSVSPWAGPWASPA